MSWIAELRALPKRLAACERGSVMTVMAVCSIILVGAVGTAIDVGRLQVAQSKLQTALDSAGLAAGSMLNTADLDTEVEKYLEANFAGANIDASLVSFEAVPNEDDTVINLSATATLPATFMRVFGHDTMTVVAATEITREMKGMEIALVVDVTGSMCTPCSKIAALRDAATDLVDILFGDQETVDDLWIGIVPFSQSVNVGTNRTAWRNATHYAGLNYYFASHQWLGCFEERYGANNRDVTDDPPSVEKFRTYFAPDTDPSSNPTLNQYNTNNWRGSSGQNQVSPSQNRWANQYCPESVLTPLTNQKSILLDGIEALDANGGTFINIGAVWGWRLLSPQWRGAWGGDMDANDLPLDYHAEMSQKAVILMTDGKNDISKYYYSAYGMLSAGHLGTTSNESVAEAALNQKTATVCNSMKANGIIVYTILFDETNTTVKNLMKNCASEEDYFFESATEEELSEAFHAIGDSLSKLRVSK